MKIAYIGKMKTAWYMLPVEEYAKRIRRYCPLELISVKESKQSNTERRKEEETEQLFKRCTPQDTIIALDERGKQMNSKQYADFINSFLIQGIQPIFLIGGAFGLTERIKERADTLLSLSSLTLQHDIALVVFLEQLYRAFTLINNEDYHK
jgi:23S rRNA (pseudouridine1915-N3)-methyltransferase